MIIQGSGGGYKGGKIPTKRNPVSSAKANPLSQSIKPDKIFSPVKSEKATYDLKLATQKPLSLSPDIRIEKVEEIKKKVSVGYYHQPGTIEQVATKILKLWGKEEIL